MLTMFIYLLMLACVFNQLIVKKNEIKCLKHTHIKRKQMSFKIKLSLLDDIFLLIICVYFVYNFKESFVI